MSAEYFYDIAQNSPEWDSIRRGIITSSELKSVLAKGRGKEPSITRRKYMLSLIADRLGAAPSDRYTNQQMERGHLLEQEAVDAYAFLYDAEPQLIGFVRNGEIGASPDRLLGDNGLMEVKTRDRHRQLECLLSDEVPAEHIRQLQGQLWICEREYVEFVSYWPGLELFVKRVERDEKLIKSIELGVEMFLNEMNELMEAITKRKAA